MVLGTDRQWDIYGSRVEQALLKQNVKLQIAREASNTLGILGLVRMGQGITIVPKSMLDYCPQGICMRPLTGCNDTIETIAVYRKTTRHKVKDFIASLLAI